MSEDKKSNRPADFDIQAVINALQGTCNILDDTVESLYPGMSWEDLTSDDHRILDMELFRCDECGWWYEISEQSGDGERCTDCNGEDENYDR